MSMDKSLLKQSNKPNTHEKTNSLPWLTCVVGFAVGCVMTTVICIVVMLSLFATGQRDSTRVEGLDVSVTYTRWGKKYCPTNSNLIYSGQVAGSHFRSTGGGVNYLCLPSEPENGKYQPFDNDGVFGVEYQIFRDRRPGEMSLNLGNKEVACAVCNRKRKSSILMIPGRKSCYKEWTQEYSGYLMSESNKQSSKEYICVDRNAEAFDNITTNNDQALLVPIRTKCGSLRCPPYTDKADIHCAVCSF